MKNTLKKRAFLISMMFILTLTPRVTGAAWTSEAIDAPKLFSTFYSRAIAIDDSGDPHIAYGEDHLYYAYHDGSSWNYETVDSSARVGQYASIAIDSSTGDVHICYYDWGNGYLKYATNATGSWVAETVDSSADVGVTTSIAVESTGDVHISYYDADNFELKYATGTSGSWSIETVDTGGGSGDVGLYSSIALDSSGNAHISYYDYKNDDLKYATNATGPWVPEQLDGSGAGDVGLYTSLAIDTLSNIHISYYDWGNGDLKYITGTAGSWGSPVSIETVSSGSEFDRPYTSITTDSLNKAHISYYDEINSDLKYATDSGVTPGAGNCGGTNWDCETVQSVGNAGLYPSIARDSSNNIHISYFYGNQGTLRHATNSGVTPGGGNCNDLGQPSPPPSNWDCETVDFSNDAGSYTSIAKDVSGKIHISYYDEVGISGVLKYITNASGSWVETVVESIGNAGKFSSIAIDSSGKAHISYYYDSNFRDLYYATNDITPGTGNCGGTDWECERVDGSGSDVGTYTSIAMDSSDTIHISYYDAGNEALKYATGTSGSWSIKTVDSSANVGILTSIALDSSTPDNKAHIAYYDLDGGNLKYATNNVAPGTGNCTDTDWNCETVDTGGGSGDVGYDNSIVIDSLNNAHISYYDFDSDNLKYATGTFGSWSIETVDTGGGEFTSIARDSSDTIHISYHDATNGDLKYATNNVTPGSGNCTNTDWDCESVDSTSTDTDLLHHTSIVMVSGNAHISYYDADLGDLKYTTNATFYTLTVSKTGAGDGTVTSSPGGIDCGTDCSHDYIGGIEVTLTPTPDASSAFTGWSGDPDCSDGVVTMNAGKSCTAAFEPAVTLTVTKAGTGSGTVTSSPAGIDCGTDCSEDYTSTTVVTLTPAPDTGSAFAGWSGDPDCSDGVVTMDPAGTDKTCTATFNLQTFTLSV
ncbi:MAG: hypothetical protein GTO60_14950, partial [Gammaproteobacteria bacterium]|nr:hypothetical protein [Gammaproteobacteria bacterium]